MCQRACILICVQNGRSQPVRRRRERKGKKRKRRKKIEREREKREREKGRNRNPRSGCQNLSDQEVKFVYSMEATLQEVGILPTLVYFPP